MQSPLRLGCKVSGKLLTLKCHEAGVKVHCGFISLILYKREEDNKWTHQLFLSFRCFKLMLPGYTWVFPLNPFTPPCLLPFLVSFYKCPLDPTVHLVKSYIFGLLIEQNRKKGVWKPTVSNCLYQIGLQVCVWDSFLTANWWRKTSVTVDSDTCRWVVWECVRKVAGQKQRKGQSAVFLHSPYFKLLYNSLTSLLLQNKL